MAILFRLGQQIHRKIENAPDISFLPKSWKLNMRHSNRSYLSNTVIFHFHDYGPKEYPFHRKNLHGTPPSALGPIRRKRGEAELAELVSDRNS